MTRGGFATTDGYDFQRNILQYFIWFCEKNKRTYELGSEIEGAGAFDDVVLDIEGQVFMIQAKQKQDEDKKITYNVLADLAASNKDFQVFKYFKSYCKDVRQSEVFGNKVKELVMWTHLDFGDDVYAKNILKEYKPSDDCLNLFKENDFPDAKRWRFKIYQDLSSQFLILLHPYYEFSEKFIKILFNKEKIHSNSKFLAKYKAILVRDVIDVEKKLFYGDFLNDNERLSKETKMFRQSFKMAIENKFKEKKIKDVTFDNLNSIIGVQIELNFDGNFNFKSAKWPQESNVVGEEDLKEFFDRFIFCTRLPGVQEMEEIVKKKFIENYVIIKEKFKKYCPEAEMVDDQKVKKIFEIAGIAQQSNKNVSKFELNISFKKDTEIIQKIEKKFKFLMIESLSPKLSIIKTLDVLKADQKPFLCLSFKDFDKNASKLKDHCDTFGEKTDFEYILITDLDRNSKFPKIFHEISGKIIFFKEKSIIISGYDQVDQFQDVILVESLSEKSKSDQLNKKIFIQDYEIRLAELDISDLFGQKNQNFVLKLLLTNLFTIDFKIPKVDQYYIDRTVLDVDRTVLDDELGVKFENIVQNGPKIIFIADIAGIGKSTLLIKWANDLKNDYEDYLVVFIELKSLPFKKDIQESFKTPEDAIKFITNNNEQQFLINSLFQDSGKVFLLLDGFDEIIEKYQKTIENCLKVLSETKVKKIIVTTRPHCEISLMKKTYQTLSLTHFSVEDQLQYLTDYWIRENSIKGDVDTDIIEKNAIVLIDKFSSLFRKQKKSNLLKDGTTKPPKDGNGTVLLGIPLQTHMIATIYKEKILDPNFKEPAPYEVGDIFNQFIEVKITKFKERHFQHVVAAQEDMFEDSKIDALKKYSLIAKYLLFNEEFCTEKFCKLEQCGIIRILDKRINFIHRTFLEYFAAFYFLTYHMSAQDTRKYFDHHLFRNRQNLFDKFLDYHIPKIDPSSPLNGNRHIPKRKSFEEDLSKIVSSIHDDKKEELRKYLFEVYITNKSRLTEILQLSIGSSTMNVFEVMFDCMPTEFKEKIVFRVRATCKNKEKIVLNLSRQGENQLLVLLNILKQKFGLKFVEKILLRFEEDEKDFFELSIQKPFLKLFEMLLKSIEKEDFEIFKAFINKNKIFDKMLNFSVPKENKRKNISLERNEELREIKENILENMLDFLNKLNFKIEFNSGNCNRIISILNNDSLKNKLLKLL